MDPKHLIDPPPPHLLNDLVCGMCSLTLTEPRVAACDHAFCRACLAECEICPTCGAATAPDAPPPRMMTNALNGLRCRCPNAAEHGCEAILTFDTVAEHVRDGCVASTATCAVPGCGETVLLSRMEEHMVTFQTQHVLLLASSALRAAAELADVKAQLEATQAELATTQGTLIETRTQLSQNIAHNLVLLRGRAPEVSLEVHFPQPQRNSSCRSWAPYPEEAIFEHRGNFRNGQPVFEFDNGAGGAMTIAAHLMLSNIQYGAAKRQEARCEWALHIPQAHMMGFVSPAVTTDRLLDLKQDALQFDCQHPVYPGRIRVKAIPRVLAAHEQPQ